MSKLEESNFRQGGLSSEKKPRHPTKTANNQTHLENTTHPSETLSPIKSSKPLKYNSISSSENHSHSYKGSTFIRTKTMKEAESPSLSQSLLKSPPRRNLKSVSMVEKKEEMTNLVYNFSNLWQNNSHISNSSVLEKNGSQISSLSERNKKTPIKQSKANAIDVGTYEKIVEASKIVTRRQSPRLHEKTSSPTSLLHSPVTMKRLLDSSDRQKSPFTIGDNRDEESKKKAPLVVINKTLMSKKTENATISSSTLKASSNSHSLHKQVLIKNSEVTISSVSNDNEIFSKLITSSPRKNNFFSNNTSKTQESIHENKENTLLKKTITQFNLKPSLKHNHHGKLKHIKLQMTHPKAEPNEVFLEKMEENGGENKNIKNPAVSFIVSPSGSNLFSPGFTHAEAHSEKEKEHPLEEPSIHMEVDSLNEIEETLEEEIFDAIHFIASLPSKHTLSPHPALKLKYSESPNPESHLILGLLPPKTPEHENKLTLVLDLDETLVHCSVTPLDPCDLTFDLEVPGSSLPQKFIVSVRWRPHLFSFLERIKDKFEIVIFTASQKIYADTLLNLIDPDHSIVHHRLFRDSCRYVNGNFIKDLDVLNRDLSRTIIVDNAHQAYAYHVSNGYPIPSWYDDPSDTGLLKLLHFLEKEACFVTDVRSIIRTRFPLYRKVIAYRELHQIRTAFEDILYTDVNIPMSDITLNMNTY